MRCRKYLTTRHLRPRTNCGLLQDALISFEEEKYDYASQSERSTVLGDTTAAYKTEVS